jgi:hypothetical protein
MCHWCVCCVLYIFIYIYICVCVCGWVGVGVGVSLVCVSSVPNFPHLLAASVPFALLFRSSSSSRSLRLSIWLSRTTIVVAYRSFLATAYKLFGEFKFGAYQVADADAFHSEELFTTFSKHLEDLPAIVLFHQGASGLKAQHFAGNFTRRALREFAIESSSLHLVCVWIEFSPLVCLFLYRVLPVLFLFSLSLSLSFSLCPPFFFLFFFLGWFTVSFVPSFLAFSPKTEISAGEMNRHLHRNAKTCIAYLDYEDENHNLMLLALEELAENMQGLSFVYTKKYAFSLFFFVL